MNAFLPRDPVVAKSVLPALDLGEAVRFYSRLGFEVECFDDGYAWVRHLGAELLHLAHSPDLDKVQNRAAIYLHVQDAGSWHAAWSSTGIAVGELVDQPWQMREFTLRDPSGNLLRVGQNL